MKARLLKKLLNDTKYQISNHRDYIAVGSPMCHDLISVDKITLKVTYAVDPFNKGRAALKDSNEELIFIWDRLHGLIESEEIKEIIAGKDQIENPLPVYTVKGGDLILSHTDHYGWPNTDDNGVCMYENTHFDNKDDALKYGMQEASSGMNLYSRRIQELENQLTQYREQLYTEQNNHDHLLQLLNQ